MAFQILIPQDVAREGKDYLLEHGYVIKMGSGTSEEAIMKDVADCDAILLRTAPVTKNVLTAGKKLKVVARHGAGYDNVDLKTAESMGIWVTNAPLSTTSSVAEFTIAMILLATKNILSSNKELQKGNFYYKNDHKGVELEGKTLGVIGLGRIGSSVAKKAALGLDMNVIAYGHNCCKDNVPNYIKLADNLEYLLQNSDIVSLHVPATKETKGLIGKNEFQLMKKSAYFINCARGEVVSENDLIEALQTGEIAGAAIDVYEMEPPDPENVLLKMPNVIATPHMGSNTEESMAKMSLHAAMEIHRVLSGENPCCPVNKPLLCRTN